MSVSKKRTIIDTDLIERLRSAVEYTGGYVTGLRDPMLLVDLLEALDPPPSVSPGDRDDR